MYESSPEYFTATVLFPNARSGTSNTAFPFSTSVVYSFPLISIVTLPVAFSGSVTVTTSTSPTLMSSTSTLIGVAYFGISTIEFVELDE